MKSDQKEVYETVVILLTLYIAGYCMCILPASVILFRMRK